MRWKIKIKSIGICRLEFSCSSSSKVHAMALKSNWLVAFVSIRQLATSVSLWRTLDQNKNEFLTQNFSSHVPRSDFRGTTWLTKQLTKCTGAAISIWIQLPGKSNPKWEPSSARQKIKKIKTKKLFIITLQHLDCTQSLISGKLRKRAKYKRCDRTRNASAVLCGRVYFARSFIYRWK